MTGAITPRAGDVVPFMFKIETRGEYGIRTEGYTVVGLGLLKEDGTEVLLDAVTPDLVNAYAVPMLSPGTYRLEVRHQCPGGTGEFRVRVNKP